MGCPALSFIAFVVLCGLLALMVIAVRWGSAPHDSRFFRDWRDAIDASREARGREEILLVRGLIIAQLARSGGWAVIVVTAGAGFPAVGAICWDIPGIIRAIGDILRGISDSVSGSKQQLPQFST